MTTTSSSNTHRFESWLTSVACIGVFLLTSHGLGWAQDPPPNADAPLPPKVQDQDQQIQPQVIIRQEDNRTVHEYSAGGRVYMVKIIPDVGPSYYLIDTTGNGDFESDQTHMEPVRPAYWRLFEWP